MNSHFAKISFLKRCAALIATTVLVCTSASATPLDENLVKNGDFSLSTGLGQIGFNTTVTDWVSNGGYNFLFTEGSADTTGAMSWYGNPLMLWGANNGGDMALATSANGGNFIGNDGAFAVSPLRQMIDGLIVGQSYEVRFEWAAAQQHGFTGETTEYWRVNLGDAADSWQATGIYSNASHSSSGWMNTSMVFTATSVSEWLTFMAGGTPEGAPPFALLDGVSMVAVVPPNGADLPEPAPLALFAAALGALAVLARRRRKL